MSDPRTAAYVLRDNEHFLELLKWIRERSEAAKQMVLKPAVGLDDMIGAERSKGAWIALESLLLAVEGLQKAKEKDVENARTREFSGIESRDAGTSSDSG